MGMRALVQGAGVFGYGGGDELLDNRPDVVPDRLFVNHRSGWSQGKVPVSNTLVA